MSLENLQKTIDRISGKREDILNRIIENEFSLKVLQKRQENFKKCINLLVYISGLNQNKIIGLLENVISIGLQDLFDSSYGFKFDLKTRGNSSACDFKIKNKSFPGWSDIVMSNGKSVQDVVAAIFRIILVKLKKRTRRIVLLDEPFSGVEKERQKLASKFLYEISVKFNIQLIVVTHNEGLMEHSTMRIKTQ